MSRGVGTPSRDLTRVVLCSSRMISMHSSTHSSQMNTVGPAISLRTSCWLLPQNEQYRVFLESPPLSFVIRPSLLTHERHVNPALPQRTTHLLVTCRSAYPRCCVWATLCPTSCPSSTGGNRRPATDPPR